MRLPDEFRFAAISSLIVKLHEGGSWCGETHIQKTSFVSERIFHLCLGHKFVFYKHGPFSFDLRADLTSMRASNILNLRVVAQGYGPSFELTDFGKKLYEKNQQAISSYEACFEIVSIWLADKDVRELEKLSSAIFFTNSDDKETVLSRANLIVKAKPHISLAEAEAAVETADIKVREITSKVSRKVVRAVT